MQGGHHRRRCVVVLCLTGSSWLTDIFQGEITVEDVRGLLERKDQERANSHFQRTDVHERLLKEKPRYSQLHAELVERLQGLLEEKYTHTEDDIPTQARPDDEEEIMKLDAVPTVTAPPTSPDQQLPAPERTGVEFSDCEFLAELQDIISFFDKPSSDSEVSLGTDKALSDLRSFSDMLSSDCNEVSLGRDKAPLDRFCTEQSSIGMKHPYRVACVEPRFANLHLPEFLTLIRHAKSCTEAMTCDALSASTHGRVLFGGDTCHGIYW
eukprot:gene5972-7178_t